MDKGLHAAATVAGKAVLVVVVVIGLVWFIYHQWKINRKELT